MDDSEVADPESGHDGPLEPGYWGAVIAAYEDELADDEPPDASTLNIDVVSSMLRRIRILTGRVADYQRLHAAEVVRLERRRDELLGPVIYAIERLEGACRQYALRSFQDFGKTSIATPNGVLKMSRPLMPELNIDDEKVAGWFRGLVPGSVIDKPKVLKSPLREWLDVYEREAGLIRRAVRTTRPDAVPTLLEAGMLYDQPLPEGVIGIFMQPREDDPDLWEEVPGLTWAPTGEQGCGRNVTVAVA